MPSRTKRSKSWRETHLHVLQALQLLDKHLPPPADKPFADLLKRIE